MTPAPGKPPRWHERTRCHETTSYVSAAPAIFILAIVWTLSAHAAEPKVLNIGWTGGSAWTALPDRIAAERGFFEKEGFRVRYIQFQGTNLMLSALLANELDYVTILPFIAGAAIRGLPVKIVGIHDQGERLRDHFSA